MKPCKTQHKPQPCRDRTLLMGQSAVRIAAGWFESRPTWTESDDAELRELMRQ